MESLTLEDYKRYCDVLDKNIKKQNEEPIVVYTSLANYDKYVEMFEPLTVKTLPKMEKQINIQITNDELLEQHKLNAPFDIPKMTRGPKFTPPKKKRKKK